MFLAKLLAALVGRIRDGDDFGVGIFLERGQMSGPDDVARTDDSDPQFAVIFLCHVSNTDVDLGLCLTIARVNFDLYMKFPFNNSESHRQ